jgi:oligopeptide/dipeptide ABC transporter ATP-binding protein
MGERYTSGRFQAICRIGSLLLSSSPPLRRPRRCARLSSAAIGARTGGRATSLARRLLASRTDGSHIKGKRLAAIPGAPPDLANLPSGCAFAPRCQEVQPACQREVPSDVLLNGGHSARCLSLSAPVVMGERPS